MGFCGVSIWFWLWRGGVRIDAYRADPPRAFLRALRWALKGWSFLLMAAPCQDALALSGRRCRLQTVRELLRDLLRVAGPFWNAFDVLSWRSKRLSVGFEMASWF